MFYVDQCPFVILIKDDFCFDNYIKSSIPLKCMNVLLFVEHVDINTFMLDGYKSENEMSIPRTFNVCKKKFM